MDDNHTKQIVGFSGGADSQACALWASRFPEMIEKVREWERRVGRTFFAPCVPGKEINWVDEVVDWSRTAHGGKQVLLPMLEAEVAAGSCMSRYGLCE